VRWVIAAMRTFAVRLLIRNGRARTVDASDMMDPMRHLLHAAGLDPAEWD
jgi:hypothetical protein